MCSYCAKELLPLYKTLIRDLESPSTIMLSNPNSKASSRARLAANVSTSMTVGGRGTYCGKEAITKPSVFRITTPLLSFSNTTPSKLTL